MCRRIPHHQAQLAQQHVQAQARVWVDGELVLFWRGMERGGILGGRREVLVVALRVSRLRRVFAPTRGGALLTLLLEVHTCTRRCGHSCVPLW